MTKILLIEADKILAQNTCAYLGGLGYEVKWHVDLQEAMFWADENQPDAVVLDLLLPGRSGIEFLYEFRSYPEWQNLPVVVFSGLAAEELKDCIESLDQLNIAAYHYKPVTPLARLGATIAQVLQPIHA